MTTTTATELGALLDRVRAGREFGANVYSTLDVLQVLYDRVLRITPATVDDPDRDRFLLSKGHAVAGYYALLAARGFVPPEWLDDQGGPASRLGDHPDRTLVPGVEIGSGSLGHGLGLGFEPPWVTAEETTVVEPGMCLAIEKRVILDDRWGATFERDVLVTEEGPLDLGEPGAESDPPLRKSAARATPGRRGG